jgi:hypothetical protein
MPRPKPTQVSVHGLRNYVVCKIQRPVTVMETVTTLRVR